jgi:hypothetical protein
MVCLLKVFIGVLTRGGIAAADVSAVQAFAQFHPTLARLETLFAAVTTRRDIKIRLLYVLTFSHEFLLKTLSLLDEANSGSDSCGR